MEKTGPDYPELLFDRKSGDINVNRLLFPLPSSHETSLLETSLVSYLTYLYIEYPQWVRLSVNGNAVALKNPYSHLKTIYSQAFFGDKSEKFAVQCLNEGVLTQIMQAARSVTKIEDEQE